MSETVKILIGFLTISLAISLLWNIKTRIKLKKLQDSEKFSSKSSKFEKTPMKHNNRQSKDSITEKNALDIKNIQDKDDVNWNCRN